MAHAWRIWLRALIATGPWLSGCAAAPSASQQAELAACTRQADASYQASNLNALARTGQNGLLYPADPTKVFEGQRLGTMDARNNQIKDCMQRGDTGGRPATPAPPPPQVIGTP